MPGWKSRAHVVGALTGGITNRNHLVDVDGARFVVRLPGQDTELLEIDRECELTAASRAAALGISPPVVGLFAGCLVTEFVPGTAIEDTDFTSPATLERVAAILRAVHGGEPLPHAFDGFLVPGLHRTVAASRGVTIPPAYARAAAVVNEIADAFAAAPEPPVPGHNDLLRANFLRDGDRLWLLDWEYAGMNDRSFDLGNLCVNNNLSDDALTALTHAYRRRSVAADVARVRLMRLVSDAREAMWGVVQQGISALDFDYVSYADQHFDRLFANASAPHHRRDLELAGQA